jgi:hypothetical protein
MYQNWFENRPFGNPGTDVMITIFCDFCQFLAKKLAFFSKTNVMIKFLHNLALFRVKNGNFFAEFFGENILKIITSGNPGHCSSHTDRGNIENDVVSLSPTNGDRRNF